MMRKIESYMIISCLLLFIISGCGNKGQIENGLAKGDIGVVRQDIQLWNCDYSLLEKAHEVTAYRLNAVSETTSSDMTIAKYKVIDKGTLLNDHQKTTLISMLSSPLNYSQTPDDYRKFFSPYFAFKFQKGKQALYLLVDISSDEWAIANEDEVLQHQLNTCRKELVQFGNDIFPDDLYIQTIIKNIKEYEE
ncbi:MAG: hypothetical protein J6M15_03075 [Prevotella sp.]|nr:hypothetical protein [Prevotella sp.]